MGCKRSDYRPRRYSKGERGQTLVFFVFLTTALMGFVTMTIAIGLAYVARRDMVNAADAENAGSGNVHITSGGWVGDAVGPVTRLVE